MGSFASPRFAPKGSGVFFGSRLRRYSETFWAISAELCRSPAAWAFQLSADRLSITSKEGRCPPKIFSTQRGGRLFGPDFRPEVVPGSGAKAVDVVERYHLSMPKSYRKLSDASTLSTGRPLAQS